MTDFGPTNTEMASEGFAPQGQAGESRDCKVPGKKSNGQEGGVDQGWHQGPRDAKEVVRQEEFSQEEFSEKGRIKQDGSESIASEEDECEEHGCEKDRTTEGQDCEGRGRCASGLKGCPSCGTDAYQGHYFPPVDA